MKNAGLVVLGAALSVSTLSGCFGLMSGGCADPTGLDFAIPQVEKGFLATDPMQPWDTLLLQFNTTESDHWINITAGSAPVERHPITPEGQWPNLTIVRVGPLASSGNLELAWWSQVKEGGCSSGKGGSTTWTLMEPRDGQSASPGQGVHVYTAGFWENGTLFYTNIQAIHDDPEWPHAGWYEWEGNASLPVYVYDKDRAEEPAFWKAPSGTVPPTGSPADQAIHDAATGAESTYGVGYFTTIPGFNQALKGLSTNTVHVARLTPEQAYTRAGNEEHPLYGHAIVFYIKVVDVVDLPCPSASAEATRCNVPFYPLASPVGPA